MKLKDRIHVQPCIIIGRRKLIVVGSAAGAIADEIIASYCGKLVKLNGGRYPANKSYYQVRGRARKRLIRRIKPYVTKILTGSYK